MVVQRNRDFTRRLEPIDIKMSIDGRGRVFDNTVSRLRFISVVKELLLCLVVHLIFPDSWS